MNPTDKNHIRDLLQKYGLLGTHQDDFINDILLSKLQEVADFYQPIGGLDGYVKKICELSCLKEKEEGQISPPPYFDLSVSSKSFLRAFLRGLTVSHKTVEIYVVGGAGDRLGLQSNETGQPLPAARLPFLGRTLLAGLFRDLEAREYWVYKLTGWRGFTPVVLMTSSEKRNNEEIVAILEAEKYFNRPKDSFFIVQQPQAPVLTPEGSFIFHDGALLLKPGGHGVLWKVMHDQGAFCWLKKKNVHYALIRQINNPLAAIDGALIAFLGLGDRLVQKEKKAFGFIGCLPLPGLAEGVLVQKKNAVGNVITNHEYTKDPLPAVKKGHKRSGQLRNLSGVYLANTNILFASIPELERISMKIPFPGMMVNKKGVKIATEQGEVYGVRLETTMQNIADGFISSRGTKKALKTFLLLYPRARLISVTKKLTGKYETPQRAFYDYLEVVRQVFKNTQPQSYEEYEEKGPRFLFFYHPAFGVLQQIIRQKLQDITLGMHSELEIEVPGTYIKKLCLQGSLRILSSSSSDFRSKKEASVTIENVTIRNKGVGPVTPEDAWKRTYDRKEEVQVLFQGEGRFVLKNCELQGSRFYVVPEGCLLEVIGETAICRKL